jgi:hypothetical protein
MHRATPIREPQGQICPNPVGICTCTPSLRRISPSLAVSADIKSPRICTFSSHFNFNPFNTCIVVAPNSSSFCTYKDRGESPMFKNSCVEFLPTPPSLTCETHGGSQPVHILSLQPLAHSSAIRANSPSVLSTTYALNFFDVPYSQAFAHSGGGGGRYTAVKAKS